MKLCDSERGSRKERTIFSTLPARSRLWLLAVAVSAVVPQVAQAHPGHGLTDKGVLHLLSSPDHLLVLVLAGAFAGLASRFVHQRLVKRILQSAGLATLFGAAILWSSRF